MAPKPFPYPIGLGIDICHIPRLSGLLGRQDDYVTLWARKVFTRLEWPHLWLRFHEAHMQRSSSEISKAQLKLPHIKRIRTQEQRKNPASSLVNNSQLLPTESSADEAEQHNNIHDENPSTNGTAQSSTASATQPLSPARFRLLAQHLAGRWAAKEAVIKAHRHRRLHMNDISILHPESSSNERCEMRDYNAKLHALIAPKPTTMVVMDSKVAKSRGLFMGRSRFWGIYGDIINGQFSPTPCSSIQDVSTAQKGRRFLLRRLKIEDDQQQIAEISISHDHDNAVAVCMALDEKTEPMDTVTYVVDDGSGAPFHEPNWGDYGWLNPDHFSNSKRDKDLLLSHARRQGI